ncbi:Zn-ribbon domain-containing OB-fold protein [Rhodococcus sp. NPDC057014]|uniref:Zn-ribbon domain-containing OB-fold protein n=1 Tax=unclassified Rhodococcus (in: high G+C Gram-positive bacteria) TaxID=192944 RepID=UPI0023E2643E|nr:Zn-ribbon domain-containing OB-fold protein [Rhodococcus sp. T2V]MDF3313278.1 Zn-ribbon domain-containing OB-fold protein [Rhodococcus sp. T2V]
MTATETLVPKARPMINKINKPFWDGCLENRLLLQFCASCDRYQFVPIEGCSRCNGPVEWREASGRGTLYTYTVIRTLYHPAFADELPYNVSVIALEEGPQILANVVDIDNDDLKVGMALEVVFDSVDPDLTVPRFKRAGS